MTDAVALISFLLLRLAQATQKAVTSPLAFARLVRANLMHRRDIRTLLEPDPAVPINHNQLALIYEQEPCRTAVITASP